MGVRGGRSLRAVLAGSLVFGTVVVGLAIGGEVPASATPTTVVNCNTGGNLQNAINAAAPGSTLIVHGTCTGNFAISQNLTLQGSGTLSGTGYAGEPVLAITSGTVSLDNLTIKNGDNTSGYFGGGIFNDGALTLTNSTISGNTAYFGGGIFNDGTVTLTNSTVSGNTASVNGGGIYNFGTTTLTNSTVSGNSASQGGGIYNEFGALDPHQQHHYGQQRQPGWWHLYHRRHSHPALHRQRWREHQQQHFKWQRWWHR